MEEWKQIPKYTQYEISTLGRIRHIKHLKIRKYKIDTSGYLALSLTNPATGVQDVVRVHRLMGMTFLGVSSSNEVVDHINRDRRDNRLENLRLTTQIQNLSNKSIDRQVIERIIRLHQKGVSVQDIARTVCY